MTSRLWRSRAILVWGAALVGLATATRLLWVLSVPTVPVSDFAMYRESANYLSEFGRLDPGFIYMPGFVALLAAVKNLGGDLLAQKLLGVFFGALGAAGLFVVTWKLVDDDADESADGNPEVAPAGWRRLCPAPHAALATVIYALWPAGVAMSSVVGTDVPAAALIVAALAILVAFGRTRPWTAALAFGAAMGLAAWVRAVALPLSALSLGYWLASKMRLGRALALTAAGLAAALVVLSPWAIRHLRQSGSLYFTDDHGGITALIGANPNSEGTYTRALNRMFKDVTGRSVLDEPHRTTDQAAYAIVREWTRFEPHYSLGLVVLKADRLFDPEIRLLYWPIFRPGVLTGRRAAWFAGHHGGVESLADAFGLTVMGLTLAGIVVALARRRWAVLALLPFQLALVASYTIFFAEPRYRLPIELLAFPCVALALGEIARLARAVVSRARAEAVRSSSVLAAALVVVVLWRFAWPALLEGGRALRARHRWAATEVGWLAPPGSRPRLLLWRPAPPFSARSPIEGAPDGVHLQIGADGVARARVRLAGEPLPAGAYVLSIAATYEGDAPVRFLCGDRDVKIGRDGAAIDVRLITTAARSSSTSNCAVRRMLPSGSAGNVCQLSIIYLATKRDRSPAAPDPCYFKSRGESTRMSSDAFDPGQPLPQPAADWAARIDELLLEAETAPAGAERTAVLCRISEIYERRLGDPNGALVTLQTALAEDPASGRVIQEMERIARGNGFWAEVVAVTAEVAGGLEDKKQASDLWVQIAFWNENGRAQLDEATRAAETALTLEPSHGGALALLENLYRRQRSWDRYVEILAQRRQLPGAEPSKIGDAYREVLRYEPRHAGALAGLASLHEESGEWDAAAEALRRLVAVLPEGAERIEAQYQLARLLTERLRDPRAAEEQLALALASAGGETHVPSLLLLSAIYRERTDWLKARQLLGRAAAVVTDAGDKTRILGEAAEICATALDDEAQAAELYTEILALDSTRTDLVEKLAEIKLRRGDFAGLLPLAELLTNSAEGEPPPERARRLHRLGLAREATGDEPGALEAFRAAAGAESSSAAPSAATLAARNALGDLLYRRQEWSEAATAYQSVLADPEGLAREAQIVAYERLGIARLRAGAPAEALEPLEKTLALDPRRTRALESLVEAARASGNDDVVVRHTQALLAVTDNPKTKLGLLEQVATIHSERRNDPQRAIAAYLEALKIWPDERSIMHRLLELYTDTKQWKQSVQLLARLALLADDATRAPYFVAAGNILAEELHARVEAIEAFEQGLDADPYDLKTFERIDQLVTEAHDWKTEERIYRRQIKRLGSEPPPDKRAALVALWHGLGEIYRTRLKDGPGAIAAFEVAARLDPEGIERRRALAELYRLSGAEAYPRAVVQHQAIIERAKTAAEMEPDLKMLVRLFVEMGTLDQAHGAAAALVLLGKADPEERALYQQYRPNGVVRAHARLTEEVWQKQVYHPEEDWALSQILATLSPAVATARARLFKDTGLKKKQRRDVASDPSLPCKVFAYGGAVLGVQTPEVYLAPELPTDVDVVNVRGTMVAGAPALTVLVLGKGVAEMRSDIELAFVAGRTLAALRPEHLLRWPTFVPTLAELEIIVRAAIRLVNPESDVPAEEAAPVAQYTTFLEWTLTPQLVEQLTALVRRYVATTQTPDVGRWSRAACFSTIRAGFLLAGDLEVAARLGQAAYPAIDPDDIVRDLCSWGVSDSYFELRAQLGLRTVNLGFRG